MKRGPKGRLHSLRVDYIHERDLGAEIPTAHPLRSVPHAKDFLDVAARFQNGDTFRFYVAWTSRVEFFVVQNGELSRIEPLIPNHETDAPLLTDIVDETFRRCSWQTLKSNQEPRS